MNGCMVATAAYLRVSSAAQSLKLQREAIRRALRARGERIPDRRWYADKITGASLERPELARLRADVRAGHVGRVYVWRIDRLSRSGIRDVLDLVQEFRRAGAELVSVADGFELEGPGGEIVLAVLAWAAQMEREAIGERIKAARARVEAEGGRWGRPRAIDPITLAEARELASSGVSVRELARRLKIPRSTLGDALAGRGHYGKLAQPSLRPLRESEHRGDLQGRGLSPEADPSVTEKPPPRKRPRAPTKKRSPG